MVSITAVRDNNGAIPRLYGSDLVAVFVGGTSGIGESTARAFIRNTTASRAYLIERDQARASRIIEELRQIKPDSQVEFIKADVSSSGEDRLNLLFLSPGTGSMKGPDEAVQGKTILITGVSPGSLGLATAEAFTSQLPTNLIISGRSTEKVQAAITHLESTYPATTYHALIMDLSSQKSVRAAASQLLANTSIPTIDILINNAGVMSIPTRTLTEDGLETTFATNRIGHFLFTNLILPKLIKAASTTTTTKASDSGLAPPTRIINLSSFGHKFSPVRFTDLSFSILPNELPESERPDLRITEHTTASSPTAQSKTANILHAISLNQKLLAKYNIAAFAVHPGAVDTGIGRHAIPSDVEAALQRVKDLGMDPTQKSREVGANTTVLAAVDPRLKVVGVDSGDGQVKGVYLADCKVDDGGVVAFATDRGIAERLWSVSEELVGERFGF
ncbi:short-chain dehydrogenase [Aspergillus piperis CBS 112811]|uniref:Short-chain dehydrogenase n=1 Tax=Aspergillus piperis CBS 112811 TaxID=1448313 RepID=A0A8G1RAX4_9EURO|nr:short-chain dehydrogenase [Aspergillus piperis CBS 112811]RAH59905.1 short-chain dehydrogenase [Aspergillus piperis CBS 112811]